MIVQKKAAAADCAIYRLRYDRRKTLRYEIIGKCWKMIWFVMPLLARYHQTGCCAQIENGSLCRLKYPLSSLQKVSLIKKIFTFYGCYPSIPYLYVVSFDGTLKQHRELSKAQISWISWMFHIYICLCEEPFFSRKFLNKEELKQKERAGSDRRLF